MSETNGNTPDLSVYSVHRSGPSAMRYYRLEVPLYGLQTLNLARTFLDTDADSEMEAMASHGADIVLIWRLMQDIGYEYAKMYKALSPKRKDGRTIYPPILVMDSDDALDYVHPFNYVFSTLGCRNFEGEVLTPGEDVYWTNEDGEKTLLWKDGVTKGQSDVIFNSERNIKNMGYHYDAARACSGLTVTTEELKRVYVEEQGVEPDRAYVYPNTIIPDDFPSINLRPHEGTRILWEGGASHMDSWWSIHEPLAELLHERPDVTLVILGQSHPSMGKNIRKEQLELHGWVDYAAYKIKRATLGADINLCPLVDQVFSRCKSAIRMYEGVMGDSPEVPLGANVGPYKEIIDGETGMLYNNKKEFKEKLSALIDNVDLRKRLGENAQKWVLANRTPQATVPGLAAFYKELKSRQRKEALMS